MHQPNDPSQFTPAFNPKLKFNPKTDPKSDPDSLDSALTRALETPSQPAVPDDFVLRVLSHLPNEPLPVGNRLIWPESIPESRVGRRIAFIGAALMLIACMALPLFTAHSEASHQFAWMAVWALFAAEFIVLTVWLSLRPGTLR